MNWNYELYKSAVTGSPLAQTETKKEEGLRSLTTKKEERKRRTPKQKKRSEEREQPPQPEKKARDYYYERDKDGNIIKKTR